MVVRTSAYRCPTRADEMMPGRQTRIHVAAKRCRGKYPLPSPFRCGIRILARHRLRQRHTGFTEFALALEPIEQFRQVRAKRRNDCRRSTRAICVSLDLVELRWTSAG